MPSQRITNQLSLPSAIQIDTATFVGQVVASTIKVNTLTANTININSDISVANATLTSAVVSQLGLGSAADGTFPLKCGASFGNVALGVGTSTALATTGDMPRRTCSIRIQSNSQLVFVYHDSSGSLHHGTLALATDSG